MVFERPKDQRLKNIRHDRLFPEDLRTPFHEFCLRSGVLCEACQKKIASGRFSNLDIDISKILMSVEEGQPEALEFLRSYSEKGAVLVELRRGSMSALAGEAGSVQERIRKRTKRAVAIFEEGEPLRAVAERLLYPAKISSMRTSWLPGGTNLTALTVVGRTEADLSEAARILSRLYGVEVNITSETSP